MFNSKTEAIINKAKEKIKANLKYKEIFLVTDVATKTKANDYSRSRDSILTEFFTDDEYQQIYGGITALGLPVKPFFSEDDFIKYILENSIDKENIIVFNLARNGKGLNKKTLIPAFCELHGIKFTGSHAYVTALGRNKIHYNRLLSAYGISVPKTYVYLGSNEWLNNQKPRLNQVGILKPAYESASRGVDNNSIIIFDNQEDTLKNLERLHREYEQPVLFQEYIEGQEVQVPVIQSESREPVALNPMLVHMFSAEQKVVTFQDAWDETYDFKEYNNKQIDPVLKKEAESIYKILGIEGYGRADFRIDKDKNYYLFDISTHPFIIEHSAFAALFRIENYAYSDLFAVIIGQLI